MKLNKKGMTIIEILISVVLVSVVLMFLFRLLVELRAEDEKSEYASKNQLNRAELVDLIESDLDKYVLTGVEDISGSSSNTIEILFHFETASNAARFVTYEKNDKEDPTVKKYYAAYTDYNGNKSTYEMKSARVSSCGTWKYNAYGDSYYFILTIPVYNLIPNNNNIEERNNRVDDLVIMHYRKESKIISDARYLTNYTTYNIGNNCNN